MIKRIFIGFLWLGSLLGVAWWMQNGEPPFQTERDATVRVIKQTENLLLQMDRTVEKPVNELFYSLRTLTRVLMGVAILTPLFFSLRALERIEMKVVSSSVLSVTILFLLWHYVRPLLPQIQPTTSKVKKKAKRKHKKQASL